ncbi:hypothetical protein LCGC14_1242780 [marine sediment metagenome]|uniref:Uncharacterized protein n=1 Tax=marine sediment metagenome TaxID=412755 RepID=A0A0F9LSH5_9ZZZZ
MPSKVKVLNEAGTEVDVHGSAGGMVHVVDYARIWTAKGYGKLAMATGAIAALIVRPSTTSHLTLYNAESGGGKHYFIERVFAHALVTDPTEIGSIWLCSHPVGLQGTGIPTGNDITVRNSPSGKAAGSSVSVVDTAEGVAADGWFPWGEQEFTPLDGTVPGGAIVVNIRGRIVVPPGAALSIAVVASTTVNDYTCGFHWFEVPESEFAVG